MKRLLFLATALLVVSSLGISGGAFAQEPILIGIPTSLMHIDGKECRQAVELAVEEINAKGGVKVGNAKRLLKTEAIDTRDSSPGVPVSEVLLGIEKIITEKKVNAIVVGPFRSEALLAAMDILAKYKMPMLGTIAMSPQSEVRIKEQPDKYKYVFRVCLNARYLVGYLVQTLGFMKKDFGTNKLFFLHQDVLWAKATAEGVSKLAAEKLGYEVVGTQAFPTGTSDFSAGLAKARISKAQVIMPIFDMDQSGILPKQWQSMRIPSMLAGFISPMAGPGAWKTFEGKIGGTINVNFEFGSAICPVKYEPAMKFCEAYAKKFGVPLEGGHGAAPSYDAVYILAEAIERAGTLDPDKLVEELKKTDRPGVIGRIKFDDGNQVIYGDDPTKTACAAVAQWTADGKRHIVFPEAVADGKIWVPDWVKTK
jgi:branched-chain amino acid transport system substrate-binding protein